MPPLRPVERPLERLRDERLLLRLPLRFEELRLDRLDLLDFDLLDDLRLTPLRDEAERDDDPPRFRADFRPRFAPPDFRDDPPLPDFLRDLRLVAAIPFPRMEEVTPLHSKKRARRESVCAACGNDAARRTRSLLRHTPSRSLHPMRTPVRSTR